MKNKYLLLLIPFIMIAMIINSCKKTGQSPIESLFTGGTWQLASIEVMRYTGSVQTLDTIINDTCTENFTFNKNNTCTYTNFDCIPQTSPSASWALINNQLYLQANVVCKDTSAAGKSMPFVNAQIINLGQFSLVLATGDLATNYSLTAKRQIIKYGFVRRTVNGSD